MAAHRKRQFVRRIGSAILVHPNSLQYGHFAMELHMAFDQARRAGVPLYVFRDPHPVNPALYRIESDDVTLLRPGPAGRLWWLLAWHAAHAGEVLRYVALDAAKPLRQWVARVVRHMAKQSSSKARRDRLRAAATRVAIPPRGRRPRPYMRRLSMREPLAVRLSAEDERIGRATARTIGIADDARLVVVHARESGFKHGREVHDRGGKPRRDDLRSARIETYFAAIGELVYDGYTVVRVGDPSMTPVHRPGVIDIATDPRRTPLLDIHLLLRAELAIVAESGPGQVALLLNTPTLTVNATDPISSFPVRADGLYILKRAREIATGQELTLRQMLDEGYLRDLRNPARFEYIDNTDEEIAAAARELRQIVAGPAAPETMRQADYRQRATATANVLRERLMYVWKHGTDEGFLGDGRIGRDFVERYW